ncbi:MAG: hypothetical protein WA637_07125 [Terriglobales bacterium]
MTSARKRLASGVLLASLFLLISVNDAHALPAFARKYGLRCSACHEAWPMLNYFGQKFKDNGYQLMNDRDAPIWQSNGYWPIVIRITPSWHRESTDKVAVDQAATGQQRVTASGFDVGGLDILTGGTLDKNLSFLFVLSSDENAVFHFESVNARFDNLFGSPWLNVKVGKFELDNIVSEKRGLTLSGSGGGYQLYHFFPVGDNNIMQIGDNQFGLEWMGHSANDRTRISASLLNSSAGNVDLPQGNSSYTGFFAGSQAFEAGKLGTQRVGFYGMIGQAPTNFLTSGGNQISPGGGFGNKGFSRVGFNGLFYLGKLDFQVVTQHGSDNAYFGTSTAYPDPLPPGARSSVWNGAFVETHYVYSPQLVFIQRSEWIRMSQQAIPGTPSNLGNIDNYVVGYRFYPIMNSRAGFAIHNEYSWIRQRGTAPDGTDLASSSVLLGFDFDF